LAVDGRVVEPWLTAMEAGSMDWPSASPVAEKTNDIF
jgi:hypothetical protein